MADIEIDTDVLAEIQSAFSSIEGRFGDRHTENAEEYASRVGPAELCSVAGEYVTDSSAHFDRMAKNMRELSEAIDPVIESFETQDEDMGLSLSESGNTGHGGGPTPV
ncbi:hypothetical protein GCM10007079_48610 [Nocardiopsis terrae]|uniref:Excreted virulence factor EspC, type VII ESX diderm n=1 Tax=Nocardiopsis terrae TaxID=372655 RepID=A0ABR9HAH9_9ACTN|nr:hypothetical protein [Nocardiopsis terrae]MBE1456022.1 hypothetical protein [Nocardiopsis terrae]GHC96243.1 hypothetical protein GCM10007079_48610 [Nocardiopsis terrae]